MTITDEEIVSVYNIHPPHYKGRVSRSKVVTFCKQAEQAILGSKVFDPNDDTTRNDVDDEMTAILNNLMDRGLLNDFAVVCDETNNPPELIDEHKLNLDVAIQLEEDVEFLYLPAAIQAAPAPE